MGVIAGIVSLVLTVISVAYQIIQAKKQKEKAIAAADARKGFEQVVEGEIGKLPIAYGRNLVGGRRVYHATSSQFRPATNSANQRFMTGYGGMAGYSYTYKTYNSFWGTVDQSASVLSTSSGALDQALSGGKNEFLFFQQVMCVGPINGVKDLVIDGSRYINDSGLGTYGTIEETPTAKAHDGVKAAMRVDYFYNGGLDAVMQANVGDRTDALFTDMAYLSAVIRLDRDNPQFSGVPSIQSLIEGRKVRKVIGGVLQSTLVYSNNPAWCLLDYLLDPVHSKGLSTSELDLVSFENAAAVCDTIVQTNVQVGGKFWQPTAGGGVTTRDLPLYECNMMIDTDKPIRDNIESILSSMGDARLIWAGGRYKLSLQYPATNADIVLDGTITDDDLALGEDITIDWPSAQDRYNFVTVKFHNEFENFKEDSVSWPPKFNASYKQGIGASKFSIPTGSWAEDKAGGRLLNNYSAWDGQNSTTHMVYLFRVPAGMSGAYTLDYTFDNSGTITIVNNDTNAVIYTGSASDWQYVSSPTITFPNTGVDTIYKVTIDATDTGGDKGVAASIYSGSRVLWTTRDTNYTNFIDINKSNAVYNAMKTEDNGLELETEIFAEGVTDPYHALAKAEELCRTSRSAATFKLTYIIKDRYYEPGDFIKLQSETLQIGTSTPVYLRVESSKVKESSRCELVASRFDYTQLAWDIKDDAYINAPSIYDLYIPRPATVWYAADTTLDSSGIIHCDPVNFHDFAGYVFYMHRAGVDATESNGRPIYNEIGRSNVPYFQLSQVNAASCFFGVRALSSNGRMSDMTTTDPFVAVNITNPWIRVVTITTPTTAFSTVNSVISPSTITLTSHVSGYTAPQYKWYMDSVLISGATSATYTVNAFNDVVAKQFRVDVNETGEPSVKSADTIVFSIKQGTDLTIDTQAPNVPTLPTTPLVAQVVTGADGRQTVTAAFTWNAVSDSDLDRYEIDIREAAGAWSPLGTAAKDVTAITVTLLKLNTSYSFRVRAVDATGNRSAYSAVATLSGQTDTTPPGLPTGLTSLVGYRTISIDWTNPTDGDLYYIEVWRNTVNNSSTATKVGEVLVKPSVAGSYVDTGLVSSTTYYYWLKAVDYNGNKSGFTSAISLTTSAVASTEISGTITNAQLVAIDASKVTGTLSDTQLAGIAATKVTGTLSDTQLAAISASKVTGQITGTQITDGAITTVKIAANAITSNEIAAGTIVAGDIAAGTITGSLIAAGTIAGSNIIAGTVTTNLIAAGAITSTEIAAGAVITSKLAAGSVTAGILAANSVTAGSIAALTITGDKIAAGAIITDKLAAGAVTADKISVGSISAISANIGTFSSGPVGSQRTVIQDALISVYDSAGNLRVRLGIW